jgi:DMSO reductase anchor subunit
MADTPQLNLSDKLFALLRILHTAMLVMALFYVGVGEIARGHRTQESKVFYLALLVAALVEVAAVLYIRLSLVPKAEQVLQTDSENKSALMSLRKWYVICFALSLGVAFYGLVLRIMDAPWQKAGLFYVVGFVLILMCSPRKPM